MSADRPGVDAGSEAGGEPTPAGNADEAARQLADLRDRLDRDLTTLESRLPPPDVLTAQARTVGGAAGAALAVLTLIGILLRRRREKRSHERDLRVQAAEIARFLPGAVDPDQVEDDAGGGAGRWVRRLLLVVAAGAAGFVAYRRLSGQAEEEADIWGPPPPPDVTGPPPSPPE